MLYCTLKCDESSLYRLEGIVEYYELIKGYTSFSYQERKRVVMLSVKHFKRITVKPTLTCKDFIFFKSAKTY